MSSIEALFQQLAAEKAAGKLFTLRDWLAANPPSDDSFTQTLAGAARLLAQGEPFPIPIKEFLDEFALMNTDGQRQRAIAERPASTGDRRFDAYLAAVAEHFCATQGLDRPEWVTEPGRFLDGFWFPSKIVGFRASAVAQSPAAFRRRGVFITTDSLRRV